MSSSDASWLTVWEWVATIGYALVLIGVIIEGVEHFKKFNKEDHARKLYIEKIGWLILVAGLAMEFLGDHAAKRISDRVNTRLSAEAAESNERSKKLEAVNLSLRAEVARLEATVEWRKITPAQETLLINGLKAFGESTPPLSRQQITVWADEADIEARWYSQQISDVLAKCGFDSKPDSGMSLSDPKAPIPLGLGIIVNGPVLPKHAEALVVAFASAGIKFDVRVLNPNAPPDGVVRIQVWHKRGK